MANKKNQRILFLIGKFKKTITYFAFSLFITFSFATRCCAENSLVQHDDVDKLKTYIDAGIEYIRKHDINTAYTEISNPNGKFKNSEMYFFVLNYNGICLADGANKNEIGQNFYNATDAYGLPLIKLMIKVVKHGGGFLSFYWPDPITNQIKLKTSYLKAIDANTFIGAGIYKPLNVPKNHLVKIEEVKAYVNFAIKYYQQHGQEAAFSEYNNKNGAFATNSDMYLGILNSQGVQLASPDQSRIGKNFYNTLDEFGTPYIKLLLETAKTGGGIVSYYSKEPSTGKINLKFSYTKAIPNTDLIVWAGVYDD